MKVCWSVTFADSVPEIEADSYHKLSYGLFVVTTKGERDNGCISNTAIQVALNPDRMAVSIQNSSLTKEIIEKTGELNVSVLTENVPFEVIKHFGMQSGRDVDKFADCKEDTRAKNGIKYIPKYTNAFFSLKVISSSDLGSHTLFVGDVTEAKVLSDEKPCTYAYYHQNIKPKKS
ncbi:MAG: flavin reductase [Clostridia bacterium]|nr:flavin reductase [Clostridia bacterium]